MTSFIFHFVFHAKNFIIASSVGISPKIIDSIRAKYRGKFIPIIGLEKTKATNNIIIPGNKCNKSITGIDQFDSRLFSKLSIHILRLFQLGITGKTLSIWFYIIFKQKPGPPTGSKA
jgi:hypothetical protein